MAGGPFVLHSPLGVDGSPLRKRRATFSITNSNVLEVGCLFLALWAHKQWSVSTGGSSCTLCIANIHSYVSSSVLYVIILSAALDLVPASTPKGLIAFCNIAPSFLAKLCWPYLLKGTIRYGQRVVGCCIMSVLGMIVSDVVRPRTVNPDPDWGIPQGCCTFWWSRNEANWHLYCLVLVRFVQPCFLSIVAEGGPALGLGELTFLQLSTTYIPAIAGRSVGYVLLENRQYVGSEGFRQIQVFCFWNGGCWASWCIPLVGASEPRCASRCRTIISENFSVLCRSLLIAAISQVLPLTIPLTYYFLLPHPSSTSKQDEEDDDAEPLMASSTEYVPLPTGEGEGGTTGYCHPRIVALSASDKWRLVRPMIPKYMLPLCEDRFA